MVSDKGIIIDGVEKDDTNHKQNDGECSYKNGVVHPEFVIDDDGIPYCKCLDDYNDIREKNIKQRYPQQFEKMLNCKRCSHYKNNDCYFPKEEIDRIEHDRLNTRHGIRCQLCGNKIDRPYSLLMSFYNKEKYGVNIPVICCMCYASLENNSFEKNIKRRIILFAISLFFTLYFILTFSLTLYLNSFFSIILFLVPFGFWIYMGYRDLSRLYYLYKGRDYYRKVFKPNI